MEIKRSALQLASWFVPERLQDSLVARATRRLRTELCDRLTDDFLQNLLHGMDLAFIFCSGYRRNIHDFRSACVFRTADDRVAATAVFENGRMTVEDQARAAYDVRVSFQDAHALWSFLLSENQDILDSILANTVDVDGNLNHLYRFGFLAKDLTRRLGIN